MGGARRATCGAVAARLQGKPGVEQIAAFGSALHVTGRDSAALETALRRAIDGTAARIEPTETGLEDVFIHLMSRADDDSGQEPVRRFSFARWWGIVLKEFLQLRRDRITFAMIVGMPIVQLILFGYAINTDPQASADRGRHRPTRASSRAAIVAAMKTSGYFDFVAELPSEEAARAALARGDVQFVVNFPADFTRKLLRGERPALLIEADATDPAATGAAIATVRDLVRRGRAEGPHGPARAARRQRPRRSTCACTSSTTPRASRSTTSCRA